MLFTFRNINNNLQNQSFGVLLADYNNYVDENHVPNYEAYEASLAEVNTTELYLELAHQMEYFQMLFNKNFVTRDE